MLFKLGLVLLLAWSLGIAGTYRIGDLVHVFLLTGLMFLLLAFMKARDAANMQPRDVTQINGVDAPSVRGVDPVAKAPTPRRR